MYADADTLSEVLAQIRATELDSFEADLRELQYAGNRTIRIGANTHELAPEAWLARVAGSRSTSLWAGITTVIVTGPSNRPRVATMILCGESG